jgi:hypothetical protein
MFVLISYLKKLFLWTALKVKTARGKVASTNKDQELLFYLMLATGKRALLNVINTVLNIGCLVLIYTVSTLFFRNFSMDSKASAATLWLYTQIL